MKRVGGRKEYTDDSGKVTETLEWFGYKLHLLVDVKHEVSLSYEITHTKAGDGETLPTIYAQAKANLPAGRIETLRYDQAADTNAVLERLSAEGVKPVIQSRNAGKEYGKTVRVPREIDLRRFPEWPRATKKFERLYKGHTAVERVNGRFQVFSGLDDGNIRGARRFFAQVGVVRVVHAAFAILLAAAPRHEATLGKMSLSPVATALRDKLAA